MCKMEVFLMFPSIIFINEAISSHNYYIIIIKVCYGACMMVIRMRNGGNMNCLTILNDARVCACTRTKISSNRDAKKVNEIRMSNNCGGFHHNGD